MEEFSVNIHITKQSPTITFTYVFFWNHLSWVYRAKHIVWDQDTKSGLNKVTYTVINYNNFFWLHNSSFTCSTYQNQNKIQLLLFFCQTAKYQSCINVVVVGTSVEIKYLIDLILIAHSVVYGVWFRWGLVPEKSMQEEGHDAKCKLQKFCLQHIKVAPC